MKKIIFFIICTLGTLHSDALALNPHLTNDLKKIDSVTPAQSCLIGIGTGLVTGGTCAFIDFLTNNKIFLITWFGMSRLRPLIIKEQFASFKASNISLEENNKIEEKASIALTAGWITAWTVYVMLQTVAEFNKSAL